MNRSSRTRHVLVRRAGVPALLLAAVLAGCRTPPPAPVAPTSPAPALYYPHWDQVCREARPTPQPIRVSEVFDTVGLGAAVASVPLGVGAPGGARPSVDYVAHYHADGSVAVDGLWTATIDSTSAAAVASVLGRRVKRLGALLGPTSFRAHLALKPTPRLELRPAIDCLPHIAHEEGRPPTGLPADVRLTQGRGSRPGHDESSEVRITLGASGEVTALERRGGYEHTFRAAERVIRGLRFDPPSSNGLPAPGTVVQTVTFSRPVPTSEPGLDSLFLVRHGFDRRASSFEAVLRLGPIEERRDLPLARRLSALDGIEIRSADGDAQLFFAGAPCPAQVVVNGYLARESGPDGGPSRLNRRPPPERAWLGPDPAVSAQISGIELYAPGAAVVADPNGCGTLLVWSRVIEETPAISIFGFIEGSLPPAGASIQREVMADPGGFRAVVRPSGAFRFFGLHPGRYSLVAREGDAIVAEGSVLVTAFETVTVQLGR